MAVYTWDPDRVLQLTDPVRGTIICIGRASSRFNSRCRWDIPERECNKVSFLLDSLSRKPPNEVSRDELEKLARWSLCEQVHQDQRRAAVRELEDRLRGACDDYEQFKRLLQRNARLDFRIRLLEEQRKKTHERFEASRNEGTKQQAELEIHKKNVVTLSDRLYSSMAELENANVRITAYQTDFTRLEESNLNLQLQLTDLSARLDKQKGTFNLLVDEHHAVKDQHQTTIAELGTARSHTESLRTNTLALEIHVSDLRSQLGEAVARADFATNSHHAVKDQYQTTIVELGTARSHTERLRTDLLALENRVSDLQSQLGEAVARADFATNSHHAVKNQHQTTITELGTARSHSERLRTNLLAVENRVSDLQSQLGEAVARADFVANSLLQKRLQNWLGAFWFSLIEVRHRIPRYLATLLATSKMWWSRGACSSSITQV